MGIISDLMLMLRSKRTPRQGSAHFDAADFVPDGWEDDGSEYVITPYAAALGPDPEHMTVVAKGDVMDFHFKRSCRMDNVTVLLAELQNYPSYEERIREHVRSVRNPNLLLKLLASRAEKSRLEAEIKALASDQLTFDEINRVGADGFAPVTLMGATPGTANALRLLRKKGFGMDIADAEGQTALIQAAKRGLVENVAALLENPGDCGINHADHRGMTALHYAAQNSAIALVEMLVNAGADLNVAALDNTMPLHLAVMAALSAEHTPQSPNLVNWNKPDALKCVEFLQNRGADLDAKCNYGFTPRQILPTLK